MRNAPSFGIGVMQNEAVVLVYATVEDGNAPFVLRMCCFVFVRVLNAFFYGEDYEKCIK